VSPRSPEPEARSLCRSALAVALLFAASVFGCGRGQGPVAPGPVPAPTASQAAPAPAPPPAVVPYVPPETLVGAGDIARCDGGAEATARLLDAIPGTIFTAGDNTYPTGSARSFRDCYGPTWGRHKSRTRPSPGNHDYGEPGAAPYYEYFGANAGDGRGYYSYMLGAWLVLSLNSNVDAGDGSAQMHWVDHEIAAHPTRCALAYWHHPVITSGPNGDNPHMQAMWRKMARAGVDVVIAGHDHIYERYAEMDEHLGPAPRGGTRQFIAGTGGAQPYDLVRLQPLSESRTAVLGVLKMTLKHDSYDWQFVSVPGAGFHDAGTTACR